MGGSGSHDARQRKESYISEALENFFPNRRIGLLRADVMACSRYIALGDSRLHAFFTVGRGKKKEDIVMILRHVLGNKPVAGDMPPGSDATQL